MNHPIVLDANTTAKLIAAKKMDLVKEIFGTAVMPTAVQKELIDAGYTHDWAANPPSWVSIRDPKEGDPKILEHNQHNEERKLDLGEAASIALAKEISIENGRPALVLSDEGAVRSFLNAEGANQKVFATNYWGVICQAASAGLVDLDKERHELERFNKPGSAEKHRDRILEMDAPDARVQRKGFTPLEKIDQFSVHLQERQQQQDRKQDRDIDR